jgi:hypothetical protein
MRIEWHTYILGTALGVRLRPIPAPMRFTFRATLPNPSFPTKYLPADGSYYQIILENDLVNIEISSIRLMTSRDERVGGRQSGSVETAE